MGTSARTILTASYRDLNVIGEGESLSAFLAQEGLRRLNRMVSGWQTQFGTVTAIERQVFNLLANKQTYTIGLGGDFNVPRPLTISGAGLWLQGLNSAVSVTSITRSGFTATVTQTAHGFAVGDEAYLTGANEIAYNGLQTVETVPTADTYTFTVEGTPTSPATGTITAQSVQGQPVEIPRTVITDDAYQAIQLKNLPNAQFTNVYYNPTGPFGTIYLWPKPDTAINQLVLYLQNLFTGFADLDTEYDYPDLPGYGEALQYNLNPRLTSFTGRALTPDLRGLQVLTLGLIKRANNKLTDLATDAKVVTNNLAGGYNINTGTGGY
jgi:hypothetical protein